MVNNLLNSLSLMVLISKYLLSLLDKVPTISKKIVDEIIDNDLEDTYVIVRYTMIDVICDIGNLDLNKFPVMEFA